MTDGYANTTAIVSAANGSATAAGLCDSYSAGGFTDWYLPSVREMSLLANNDIAIDRILDNDSDPNTNGLNQEYITPTNGIYWCSLEFSNNSAWFYFMGTSTSNVTSKENTYRIRAIREF